MATRERLDQLGAAQQAYRERFDEAIVSRAVEVETALQIAQTELVTGMLMVAEVCSVDTANTDRLAELLHRKAETVVRSIFSAAILEVGREDYARSEARNAGDHAEMEVRERQLDDMVSHMGSVRRRPGRRT